MLWFNYKLTIVAVVCCLSFDGALGTTLGKNNSLSSGNKDEKLSSHSSNDTKGTDFYDDLNDGFGLDKDSEQSSKNKTKDTGSNYDLTDDFDFDTGSKKKEDNGSKKNTTISDKGSTNGTSTKDEKNNSTTDWLSDLDTDDSFSWPNDQGSINNTKINSTSAANTTNSKVNSTSATNTTSMVNSTSAANTTNSKANSTSIDKYPNGIFDKPSKNSSQSVPSSSSSWNNPNAGYSTEPPNSGFSSERPNAESSSTKPPTSHGREPTKQSTGYWIPIFNFGNDLYFMTNKGYAQLVNFPAPIVYSFKPVSRRQARTRGHGQARQEQDEFFASFFQDDSMFAECYISSTMGNLFPYSYFGSWAAVFELQNGWHLQTYSGLVPLEMTGEDAPVTYEFEPVEYQYSSLQRLSTQAVQQSTNSDGLATWSEPIVVEN